MSQVLSERNGTSTAVLRKPAVKNVQLFLEHAHKTQHIKNFLQMQIQNIVSPMIINISEDSGQGRPGKLLKEPRP